MAARTSLPEVSAHPSVLPSLRPRISPLDLARVASISLPVIMLVALVLGMWAPGARYRGLNYETTLVYDSSISTVLGGFLWAGDPMRIFTTVFYHLSYLLAEFTGNSGDYIFYQYVYAALWFGRGLLVFFIIRTLLPMAPIAAYLAAGLTIVHASDGAINWVGQLNQFGFMFWLALATLFFAKALVAQSRPRGFVYSVLAAGSAALCLWSYESPLPIILVLPILLFLLVRPAWNSVWWFFTAWYVVPAIYTANTLAEYLNAATAPQYQQSIISKNFTIAGALADWWTHCTYSLEFWRWNDMTSAPGSESTALVAGLIGTAVFCVVSVLYIRTIGAASRLPSARTGLSMLGAGLLLLVLSFPIYLIIDGNTSMWRTQMLSGFGAALVFAAVAILLSRLVIRGELGPYLATAVSALVVFFGINAGVRAGAFHSAGWERQRALMDQVVHLVPDVRGDALILITDLPKAADPFGDGMWFDFPIRLAYPSHTVAGGLVYSDPSTVSDTRWNFGPIDVEWNGQGYPPPVSTRTVPYSELVILQYRGDGQLSVLMDLPDSLGGASASAAYNPIALIEPGPVQAANERRFTY